MDAERCERLNGRLEYFDLRVWPMTRLPDLLRDFDLVTIAAPQVRNCST